MAKPISRTYPLTREQVFDKALAAATKLKYRIADTDKANGLIRFKTAMSWLSWTGQDMSISILDNGNGTCTVNISGVRNPSGFIQVTDWGEAGMVARKVFDEMDKKEKDRK